jgi:heat-inducible transcriptional repressor
MKTITPQKVDRHQREKQVLLGLVEQYLISGKPIGSHTLKEAGFDHLSSATIRNYFAKLEEEGFLMQPHTSGGRLPTEKAFQFYACESKGQGIIDRDLLLRISELRRISTKEIGAIIRKFVEQLSSFTGTAAFISAPRFDRDFVVDIKVVPLDHERCLFVVLTDFGMVQTEVLPIKDKLTTFSAKRIESYLRARLTGQEHDHTLEPDEERIAQEYYNEVMVRFLIGYSNFAEEDLLWNGLSEMLHYPEFRDPALLAESMALYENSTGMRHLVRDVCAHQSLKVWIGDELKPFAGNHPPATVAAIPYRIHQQTVGALGILGPMRIPYRKFYGILEAMSEALSDCLTQNLYKFKLTFRQPMPLQKRIEYKETKMIEHRTKP